MPRPGKTFISLIGVIVYTLLSMMTLLSIRDATWPRRSTTRDTPESFNVTTPAQSLTLITLFTTFRFDESKAATYRNTIRNWGLLAPYVRPVLYYAVGDDYLTEFARMHGWAVYECPRVGERDVPILRSMFLHAQSITGGTPFYGYANSDILFDRNLVSTLEALKNDSYRFKQLLVVGRRVNYKFKRNHEIHNLTSIYQYVRNGALFITYAQDYFISTHSGYPWDTIPDFVVGRVGYDNWIVANAVRRNISVVDATPTLSALHQTGQDGDYACHRFTDASDRNVNYQFVGKHFNYLIGITTCSHFVTQWVGSRVTILERPQRIRIGHQCDSDKDPHHETFVKEPHYFNYRIAAGGRINVSAIALVIVVMLHNVVECMRSAFI